MDCILKIIAGPENGQEFSCPAGETYLGRSQRCLVRLSSPAISFEHALITRIADDYFVENLSANGTLLNGQRLLTKTRLRPRDQIQLADTIARVESLPAAASAPGNRRLLLLGFVVLLIAALFIILVDPFSTTASASQRRVYRAFQQFAQDQAAHNGMPRDGPALLSDAWRLHTAGDKTGEAKAWVKVQVMLDTWDQQQGRVEGLHSSQALTQLETADNPNLSDEDLRIALKQWILKMERAQ